MKRTNKIVPLIVLALASSMVFAVVTPAFAYNFNVPENVANITYSTGGEGVIEVPADWPPSNANASHPASLKIEAKQIEAGFFGRDEDNIVISVPYGPIYLPVAFFTTNTNPDALSQVRTILSGLPVSAPTNSKVVSDSALIVERHGNRITVELTVPQMVKWANKTAGGKAVDVLIPAFKFELDKVDGSVHREAFHNFTGYPMASKYTDNEEETGFNGVGFFTCSTWGYTAKPMTSCFIVMHGITTYFSPP